MPPMTEDVLSVETELNLGDYRSLLWRSLAFRRVLVALGVFWAALMSYVIAAPFLIEVAFARGTPMHQLLFWAGFLLVIAVSVAIRLKLRLWPQPARIRPERSEICIDGEGVSGASALGTFRAKWGAARHLIETGEYFVVGFPYNLFLIIPKRAFASQDDERAFLLRCRAYLDREVKGRRGGGDMADDKTLITGASQSVSVEITDADFHALQRIVMRHKILSVYWMATVGGFFLVLVAYFVFAPSVWTSFLQEDTLEYSLADWGGFLVLAAAGNIVIRSLGKKVKGDDFPTLRCEYVIDRDGIRWTSDAFAHSVTWRLVREIAETPQLLIFPLHNGGYIYMPKRGFASRDAAQAFVGRCRDLFEAAKARS